MLTLSILKSALAGLALLGLVLTDDRAAEARMPSESQDDRSAAWCFENGANLFVCGVDAVGGLGLVELLFDDGSPKVAVGWDAFLRHVNIDNHPGDRYRVW